MIPDLDTMQEHGQHALDAGFSDVEVRDITLNMRRSLRRLCVLALAGVTTSRVLHRLRLRSAVSHGNVLGSLHQYRALRRASWAYGILFASKPSANRDGLAAEVNACSDRRGATDGTGGMQSHPSNR